MTHETTAPVQSLVDEVLAELDQSVAFHREMNTSNYDHDDVCRLNDWGVDACTALEKAAELIREQQSELARQAAPVAVPDGWKLVPLNATQEMWAAYRNADDGNILFHQAYRTMLAAAPTPPAQQLDLKLLCTHFYYWWHNQPGTNTEQGFDAWFEAHGRALLPIHSDAAPPAFQRVSILQDVPVRYSASAGSKAVNPDTLLPGSHAPTPPAGPWESPCTLPAQQLSVFWVLFDATCPEKFIKKMMPEGFLAFFDNESDARRAKAQNPGTDFKRVEYYKAPPAQMPVAPIGKVLSDDEMGISYDRRMGPVVWFGSPKPGLLYAAPPAPEQTEPDAVKVPIHERWAEIESICWRIFEDGKKEFRGCTKERLEELRDLLGGGA